MRDTQTAIRGTRPSPRTRLRSQLTSALIGIAINEKLIGGVEDLMVPYLPELRGKGLDGVTLQNLLTMSAGIHYIHEDEQPPLLNILPFNDDSRCTNYPDLRSLSAFGKAQR
jgi:CubicO group peptidase (beta-lactamase class C family)